MAQQQAAAQVAKLLSRVGRWGIILGVGGSALQASLYTGRVFSTPLLHRLLHVCAPMTHLHAWLRPARTSGSSCSSLGLDTAQSLSR